MRGNAFCSAAAGESGVCDFSADSIKNSLGTKIVGREIHVFDRVSSTQDVARELVQEHSAGGTVILAESQINGRGRFGKRWFSPHGSGILASVILYPRKFSKVNVISIATALAVANAIGKVAGLKTLVKWPNDVIISGRKAAGVLVETAGKALIVGIGINVNTDAEDFPQAIRESATSLLRELGRKVSRIALIKELLIQVEHYYGELEDSGIVSILREFRELSYVNGRQVTVFSNGRDFEGEAVNVDDDGALVIRLDSGVRKRILTGEVRVVC